MMNKQEPAEAMEERDDILQRLVKDNTTSVAFVPYFGMQAGHVVRTIQGKVRIMMDFPDVQASIMWLADAQGCCLLPSDVTLYKSDAIDDDIKDSNVFVVKRKGDRPEDFMLHERTISEEGV